MAVNVPNFDDKIRVIIGDLLMKADPESKLVISAFDPAKDTSVNSSVLGGSKFNVPQLDACAKFLNIETTIGEKRIFSNKPSLAKRIILEIKSFFPTACAECNEEYAIHFNSDNPPTLRCFLCFHGSHSCDKFQKVAADKASIIDSLPSGSVWLCN